MKLIRSLLEQYIDIPKKISAQELAHVITNHIAEVEQVEEEEKAFENIVVGQIKEIHPHPDADKLKITKTDVGGKTIQILCGGTNIKEGMKVIVAKLGATVYWHGQEEPTVMKEAKIRGQVSEGMICAAEEVHLSDLYTHAEREIVELPSDAPVGAHISDYLNRKEQIFDIDNKAITHRPDLWGYYGFARDISAVLDIPFKPLDIDVSQGKGDISMENECPDLCPTLTFQKFSTGLPQKSPLWMRRALNLSGIKSINTLVDITNFVMLELGQPLHAYDVKQIAGKVVVRTAKKGEKIRTLDDMEHILEAGDIVIADSKRILGIAGIMGGENTEIRDDTTEILLEAATFDPVRIRKTATRLGVYTEAARRFEKSLDPALPRLAIARCAELLSELQADYAVSSAFTEKQGKQKPPVIISFDPQKAERVMGKKIINGKDILIRLGFSVDDSSVPWKIDVPSWRGTKDVTLECDIVEEIVRVSGYMNVVPAPFSEEVDLPQLSLEKRLERKLAELLTGFGFYETMTYSFVGKNNLSKFGETTEKKIPLKNTLSSEHTHLRSSLLFNLSEYVHRTLQSKKEVRVFEIGRIFGSIDDISQFDSCMALIALPYIKQDPEVLYEGKELCEAVLDALHASYRVNVDGEKSFSHPYRYCEYVRGKELLAKVYELHPRIAKNWKWNKMRVAVVEFNLPVLIHLLEKEIKYAQPPQFPSIFKGISVYFDKKILVGSVASKIKNISPLINAVNIVSVYEGEEIPNNQKAVAFELIYLDPKKTLEEEEIMNIHKDVEKQIEVSGGVIRSE